MTTSNFRTASKPNLERWKTIPYPEYAHMEASDFGRIRNRVTNTMYTGFKPNSTDELYVTCDPAKGIPGKRRSIAVARLVYETWHGVLLPRGILPEHINGDAKDNRLVNLKLPKGVTFGTPPVVKELPVIRPSLSKTETGGGNREQEYAKRYAERMEHLRVAISCCADWQSIEDIERLGILDSEWVYALEDLPVEQVAVLVLKLLAMLAQR